MIWLPEKKIIMPNRGILPNRAMRRAMPKDQRGFVLPGMFGAGAGPQGSGLPPIDDPAFSSNVMLAAMNGANNSTTQTDLSTYARALTFGGTAKIDTSQSLYGGSSLYVNGSGSVSMADATELNPGTGPFCFDLDFRFASTSGSHTFVAQWAGAGNRALAWWYSGGMRLSLNGGASTNIAWTPSAGAWYHLRLARVGDNVYSFVDGILLNYYPLTASYAISNVTANWVIGADSSGLTGANGHFQEVRLSMGHTVSTANFARPITTYPRS